MEHPGSCARIRRSLGLSRRAGSPGARDDAVRNHLVKCLPCNEIASGFAALDALLAAEPAPSAPLGLARSIRAELVAQRAAARRARLATWAGLVGAAAAALAAAALGPPPATLPPGLRGWFGLEAAAAATLARLEALGVTLAAGAGEVLAATPTPPWIALLVAAPALAYVNWTLSRGPAAGARP